MSICYSNVYWTNEGDQISSPPHRPSSPRPSKASIYRTAFGGANGRWSIHRSRKQKMSRPRATRIQHAFKLDQLKPVKLILWQMFFNCVTFTLGAILKWRLHWGGEGGLTKCRHSKGGCLDLVLWILPNCRQGGGEGVQDPENCVDVI